VGWISLSGRGRRSSLHRGVHDRNKKLRKEKALICLYLAREGKEKEEGEKKGMLTRYLSEKGSVLLLLPVGTRG